MKPLGVLQLQKEGIIKSLQGGEIATAILPLINSIQVMGILSKEVALLFLPPFSVGVNSERKEFAPRGANSSF